MDIGTALGNAKIGKKIARDGWNGKNMYAVYMPGYPDGIAINQVTADATGIPVGTVCVFRPYLLLYTAQGDFAHWVPSGSDLLATDWTILT